MKRFGAAMAVSMVLGASAVAAQESATLNRFSASALLDDDFQVDRPDTPGHLVMSGVLHLDHGLDPLVYFDPDRSGAEAETVIVGHQLMANATFGLGIGERLLVFAGLPATLWMDGEESSMIASPPLAAHDGPGLGDLYLGGRAWLWGTDEDFLRIAGQLTVTFPTAGDQQFRGEEFLSLQPEFLATLDPGADARVTMNLGGRVRRSADDDASNLRFGSEFSYALGFAMPVWRGSDQTEQLELHAQAFGTTTFRNVEESPVEMIGGAKYFNPGGWVVGLAAGPGLSRGFGSPIFRSVLMVGYEPPLVKDSDGDGLLDPNDACPLEPEDRDSFEDADGCPDPDNDKDSILDGADQCPLEPEDADGFQDDNGCPDPDNDKDGILDGADRCPLEPEDADGFEDSDGCPDPDNDQDSILDVEDECPLIPGVVAMKGCPDPDRDGDGVLDRLDNCPDEPGPASNQGCVEEQKVKIEESRLQILEKVYFRTGKATIQKRSFGLLDNVATVLQAHPEISRIVVEGHTDSRGKRRYNLRLSQDRAESVVKYLVDRGVAVERLEAKGYGPDQPIVPDAKRTADHAKNRRVEFNISTPTDGVEQGDSAIPETE